MLIEFSVTNFRSIKGKQTLSMVADKALKELPENTFATDITKLPHLLSSAVIYGANASGKSNFIQAIAFMEHMVVRSAREADVGEPITDVAPFKLSAATIGQDSEFEVHFVAEGVRYQYGFSLNRERIHHEFLIAYPNNRAQRWFERVYDAENKTYQYKFGDTFDESEREQRKNLTIPTNLYLSVAVKNNSQKLLPVFSWFRENLCFIGGLGKLGRGIGVKTGRLIRKSEQDKQSVIDFLHIFGLVMKDVAVDELPMTPDMFHDEMPDDMKIMILVGATRLQTKFIYQSKEDGNLVEFDFKEESAGTKNLFRFCGHWLEAIQKDFILVIDEIDASLHPLLVRRLIELLHRSNSRAQLIFTTHDTTLLSQHILRRDQVWFIERDQHLASQLYSLADFSPRKDEALEKGYLHGRYGAIPFLSELDFYG